DFATVSGSVVIWQKPRHIPPIPAGASALSFLATGAGSCRPLGLPLFHTKRPQIERTFPVLGCVMSGDLANERRRPNPSTRNTRQSLTHGLRILCLYAYRYSSGAGKCDGRCDHRTRNQKSKIRSSRASTTSLPIGQCELLVLNERCRS